ncbi:hypothetical protein C1H46_027810 [Malus baccata]|uniref:Elongation factor EFG domain-containing protein n=1 Tax=Malus baccata TaxID=106549 RepID=A0A540LJP8_MALBA|nr:hypothetical protein C1H46_027810 [Malus baccata]
MLEEAHWPMSAMSKAILLGFLGEMPLKESCYLFNCSYIPSFLDFDLRSLNLGHLQCRSGKSERIKSLQRGQRNSNVRVLTRNSVRLLEDRVEALNEEELPSIDDDCKQQEVSDYVDEIYQYYWVSEAQNPPAENFMSIQAGITHHMRGILVNCILVETYTGVQVLGMICAFLRLGLIQYICFVRIWKCPGAFMNNAAFYSSLFACPKINTVFAFQEKTFLNKLKFRLNAPTPYVFMLRFLKAARSETKGLRLLNRADPFVGVTVCDRGENVVSAAGEVHLQRCIKDLKERFAMVSLEVSPPLVSYKETIEGNVGDELENLNFFRSSSDYVEKRTANGRCTIRVQVIKLPPSLIKVLEDSSDLVGDILGGRASLQRKPRLVEAMYFCELNTTTEHLGSMYAVLGRRRARVLKEEMQEGYPLFFADELRRWTAGAASALLVLSHWEALPEDPFFVPKTEEELEEFGDGSSVLPNTSVAVVDIL